MTIKRAFHELFGNGLYFDHEVYVQIPPYVGFKQRKRTLNTRKKALESAKAFLGDKYCLISKPMESK